jgi:hypothetical protein
MPMSLTETKPERSLLPATTAPRWKVDLWLLSVVMLSVLMCLPFLRAVNSMGDEGVLLNGAERLLHGEILYKDFFEFLPPGGFVLTAWWFGIAGISVLSARLLGILVIAGIAGLTFLATRQATRNAPLSAVLTIGWVTTSQGPMTQLSHHWLTTMFSMMAFWAALASPQHPQCGRWGAFLSGATAGAAVLVTPTCGALAWLAAASFFLRQGPIELLRYLGASATAPAFLLAYLIAQSNLTLAYADCIRFPVAHYASIQGVPFGYGIGLQTYPLVSLFPAAGLLAVLVCAFNGRNCLSDRRLQLCVVFAVAGFIGCFPRPDESRIGFATPLALPLFAYCVSSLAQHCRPIYAIILRDVLIALCIPSALVYGFLAQAALHTPLTRTPRGDVSLIGQPGMAAMLARLATTPSGDRYFFYPYMPLMSFLTGREQVSKYDLFTPGYTLPSQYQDTCLSVMQHANWIVVDGKWTPAYWKSLFPAMQNPNPPEAEGFERALDRGFDVVARAGTLELRHRNASTSIALCTGIAG